MRLIIIVIIELLFLTGYAYSQQIYQIKGTIVQEDNAQPIPGASIFVSNTSKGTISGKDGSFTLNEVPAGDYELVISSIGFHTVTYPYSKNQLPLTLRIQLKPKTVELESVTVEPDEKDGWNKWGKFFIENFIGTSANAVQCRIRNKETLRFKFSRKNNRLTVIADQPLEIENKALGYVIKYQLEEFQFQFSNRMLIFLGYPLFVEMKSRNSGQIKRWQKNREIAYRGSMQQFMKGLYENNLQGYEIRRMVRTPNLEKQRIKKAYADNHREQLEKTRTNGGTISMNFGDSAGYYERILRQPDYFETYSGHLLNTDSVVSSGEDSARRLFFNDYLSISYILEKEEPEYLKQTGENRGAFHQRSLVYLQNAHPVSIQSNGNYSPLLELISLGYWSWSEKIGNMLPLDWAEK